MHSVLKGNMSKQKHPHQVEFELSLFTNTTILAAVLVRLRIIFQHIANSTMFIEIQKLNMFRLHTNTPVTRIQPYTK